MNVNPEQKKKRLCFIVPSLGRGGAERNLVTVINNIDETRFEIFLICLVAAGDNYSKIKKSHVHIIDLNNPSIYFSIFKFRKEVRKINPDVLIGWMGFVNAYLAFFKMLFPSKMKWVCRESSIASIQNRYFKYPFIFSFLYRFLNRYDAIICQSQAMAEDLQVYYKVKRSKITIINNPGDFSDAALNIEYGVNKNHHHRLLYVGNFSREKRVHLLIEALSLLPPSYSLTILGDGDQANFIQQKIEKLKLQDQVVIKKDCSDPRSYYQSADCLLLCSNHEGFPNVAIEAMGAGCPVIGYNIAGGANEILKNYGGFIVKENNISIFAAIIRRVCETKKIDRELVAKTARSIFDKQKIIQQYEAVFK